MTHTTTHQPTSRTVRVKLAQTSRGTSSLTLALVALVILSALAVAVLSVTSADAARRTPDAPGTGSLVPCVSEDEEDNPNTRGCVWDAIHRGNGVGHSFIVTRAGKLIPVPHYVAHALVFGSYGEGSPRN